MPPGSPFADLAFHKADLLALEFGFVRLRRRQHELLGIVGDDAVTRSDDLVCSFASVQPQISFAMRSVLTMAGEAVV